MKNDSHRPLRDRLTGNGSRLCPAGARGLLYWGMEISNGEDRGLHADRLINGRDLGLVLVRKVFHAPQPQDEFIAGGLSHFNESNNQLSG